MRRSNSQGLLFEGNNLGWTQVSSTDLTIIYRPDHPASNFTLSSVSIQKEKKGLFTLQLGLLKTRDGLGVYSTMNNPTCIEIRNRFEAQGRSVSHMSEAVGSIQGDFNVPAYCSRDAATIGILLGIIHSLHAFDNQAKGHLLAFVGLNDFPAAHTPSRRGGCTII